MSTNRYLLLIECEVRTVSYGPEFFSILMAQASITYGTDQASEVNKMIIILLFFLLFLNGTDFVLLVIFPVGRTISKRERKFPRFSLTHVVSVGFQISQSE